MKFWVLKIVIVSIGILTAFSVRAQDIFTRGLVYQVPGMQKVTLREQIIYRTVNDTALGFDIYYPPSFDFKKSLPLVIFNNGAGGMDVPRWGVYKDWAKLIAANGMIAVNYQARNRRTLEDGEALLDYLKKNAGKLNIDPGKIGLWTCSANTATGMRLAHKTRPAIIKALVVYYGNPDSLGQLRQDLPTLFVRAALDAQFINTGIDNFIQASLQQDTRLEVINYLNGIHAFDVFTNSTEAKDIIIKTVEFLKKNLLQPVTTTDFVLTNKNFMWLVMNNQLPVALAEFRKIRVTYRADSSFQPFYNAVIREDVLNANAYWLLNHQRQNDALEVFKLAVESYPASPNAYESLSEAFEITGNKAEAARNAELCLLKLPGATGISENFKNVLKQSAEQRIARLVGSPLQQAGLPPKRAHHELVYDEAGKTIIMTAGSTPLNGGQSFAFYNDLWRFDGREWKQEGIAGDQRSGIRMAWDTKRSKLFSYGGFANDRSLPELRVFENREWKTLSNDPSMNAAEPGFVYDSHRDRLIAFGGTPARGQVNSSTWEWDGTEWKKLEVAGPPGRLGFAMVYDTKRKKTVLYGGMGGANEVLGDTWEWDGSNWLKVSDNGPGARISPGYAYDYNRGMLVIFGGINNGNIMNDTWGWNGKEWKKLADTGPSARVMGTMAYDKTRDRIVLFGGRPAWPNDANDTWEWDGREWKEIKLN
ncbi:MAG: hypothetical protein H7Y01_02650 [Ferruginibacter sp.]|nr:hypothetical protein [Chitinophagaceae bacterium]